MCWCTETINFKEKTNSNHSIILFNKVEIVWNLSQSDWMIIKLHSFLCSDSSIFTVIENTTSLQQIF